MFGRIFYLFCKSAQRGIGKVLICGYARADMLDIMATGRITRQLVGQAAEEVMYYLEPNTSGKHFARTVGLSLPVTGELISEAMRYIEGTGNPKRLRSLAQNSRVEISRLDMRATRELIQSALRAW
jgi:hypothetical protein